MVRPEPQRPFEGLITIHCELSPMTSIEYEPGRYVTYINAYSFYHTRAGPSLNFTSPTVPRSFHLRRQSEEEVALSRMLDKIFRRSDTVDREALCIVAGERVRQFSSPLLSLLNPPSRAPGLAPPYLNPRARRRRRPPRLCESSLRRRAPTFPSRRRRSARSERRNRPPTRTTRSHPSSTTPHALLYIIFLLPRHPCRSLNVKIVRSGRDEGG